MRLKHRINVGKISERSEKLAIIFALAVLAAAENPNGSLNCRCWEDFKPEKEGNSWFCRGTKNYRIFACNEEKPPLCTCMTNGKPTVLDLGETHCISIDVPYDSLNCEPESEWKAYFSRHPEKMIYH
ncbi:hypothetical protein NQ315_009804 [Exocentrus adspersus]|uniref:Secreted protein n=1 Tax=Exocentrus adspersus TaxID=1586481 RepID=A0AAV8WHM7_9CUCU|nr:hypothetical protein NQ315_009804 [Exocentrus adspersus]